MAADFEYQVPRFGLSGTGTPTEMDKLRINLFWLWCVAANADNIEQGYLVPGFDTTITAPVAGDSSWTDIILDWDGTDTLKFRLTPTWLAPATSDKTITAMAFEMDTGAGWETLTGPDGSVALGAENPRWHYKAPDPRAGDCAVEMGYVQDSQLFVMAAAAFQNIYDEGQEFRLPGYTTTVTQLDNLTREIKLNDSAGPGTMPCVRFVIENDRYRDLPARICMFYQRDVGETEYLASEQTIEHDGDGRVTAMNRGSV